MLIKSLGQRRRCPLPASTFGVSFPARETPPNTEKKKTTQHQNAFKMPQKYSEILILIENREFQSLVWSERGRNAEIWVHFFDEKGIKTGGLGCAGQG